MSRLQQRLAMGAMVVGAVLALGLAAVYQDDNKLDGEVSVIGAEGLTANNEAPETAAEEDDPVADGTDANNAAVEPPAGTGSPIEAWLPASGEASACSEPVGVDLVPGYGAKLTINDIEVAPEDMNVNLDPSGEITNEITASRSLGQYTFEPEDGCPNGRWLRPTSNVLTACVFSLDDADQRCVLQSEKIFDAL